MWHNINMLACETLLFPAGQRHLARGSTDPDCLQTKVLGVTVLTYHRHAHA